MKKANEFSVGSDGEDILGCRPSHGNIDTILKVVEAFPEELCEASMSELLFFISLVYNMMPSSIVDCAGVAAVAANDYRKHLAQCDCEKCRLVLDHLEGGGCDSEDRPTLMN